jgi:hypothetical protein
MLHVIEKRLLEIKIFMYNIISMLVVIILKISQAQNNFFDYAINLISCLNNLSNEP